MLGAKANFLVTGASRGLGLEFVKQLTKHTQWVDRIFATSRTLSNELKQVTNENSYVHFLKLDVTKEADIIGAVKEVSKDLGEEAGLNFLINNAGISTRSARLEWCNAENVNKHLATNVTGPILMAKEFFPLLTKGEQTTNYAAIINITSIMGCMTETFDGHHIPYRVSKAALNMLSLCLNLYLKEPGIQCYALHPGWAHTNLGGTKAPLSVEESVRGCLEVIQNPPMGVAGRVVDYQGHMLPW